MVILEPKKIKIFIVSIISPTTCHEVMEPDATIFVFWMFSFKPAFLLSGFHIMPFHKKYSNYFQKVDFTFHWVKPESKYNPLIIFGSHVLNLC